MLRELCIFSRKQLISYLLHLLLPIILDNTNCSCCRNLTNFYKPYYNVFGLHFLLQRDVCHIYVILVCFLSELLVRFLETYFFKPKSILLRRTFDSYQDVNNIFKAKFCNECSNILRDKRTVSRSNKLFGMFEYKMNFKLRRCQWKIESRQKVVA